MLKAVVILGAVTVSGYDSGSSQLDIEQRMVIAMDTCIEYMTLAMQCDPPKKKLEKVCNSILTVAECYTLYSVQSSTWRSILRCHPS